VRLLSWRDTFLAYLRAFAQLGIVGHLVIAFVAVGALAIAANLVAVHGTVFVYTVPAPVERVTYLPAPAAPAPIRATEPSPAISAIDATDVSAAIDGFERETLLQVADARNGHAGQFASATERLRRQARAYASSARPLVGSKRSAEFIEQVESLEKVALELVRMADSRKALVTEYRGHFESMEVRMQGALDGAWKIFGRVIAREALIELNGRLGDIRRRLDTLEPLSGATSPDIDLLREAEAAFLDTLNRKADNLARSQDAGWVASMRADHALLGPTRTAILREDDRRQVAMQSLGVEQKRIAESIAHIQAGAARSQGAKQPARGIPASRAEADRAASLPVPQPAESKAVSPATSAAILAQPAGEAQERPAPGWLAWLSGGVVLLLLTLSTLMAMRIIRPVRRLEHATRLLAEGDLHTRVARGGIRELDSLGVSFNRMADRLAAARAVTEDHQHLLEAKVSERTRQLKHLAEHDPLTELPNRRQLFSQLTQSLVEAEGTGFCGVMVIDLDNFKNINDTMGHAYGDRVLQAVAHRLETTVSSFGFSARQGGDEFTVVCQRAGDGDAISRAGEEILRAFAGPLTVDGRDLAISLSIGIAVYPTHAQDADALLRAADAALFRAKAQGRHRLSMFSPDLLDAAASRFRTEQGLRQAIENGEFELAFQPEVNARTFEVELVEALLRWRLPDGRLARPEDFLAVAEDSGLIVEISDWVLRSAIAAAAKWHHGTWPGVRVAINVSPRQVAAPGFADLVVDLLARARLPSRCIEIELTEYVLQTGSDVIDTLEALRRAGVGIALDDFGTGYSSLASLERLPLTRVKLDRSLVARIDSGGRSLAIAQAIINLCGKLGFAITAEGIERPAQLSPLLGAASMYLQGYLLARPQTARQIDAEIAAIPLRMKSLLADGCGTACDADELPEAARPPIARSA
jgi:diguanylate cyclase (GGDEF)-like protein